MSECDFIKTCPMFNRFKNERLKNTWIDLYCNKDHEECQRKIMRMNGETPPNNMLPTGLLLKSLQ